MPTIVGVESRGSQRAEWIVPIAAIVPIFLLWALPLHAFDSFRARQGFHDYELVSRCREPTTLTVVNMLSKQTVGLPT